MSEKRRFYFHNFHSSVLMAYIPLCYWSSDFVQWAISTQTVLHVNMSHALAWVPAQSGVRSSSLNPHIARFSVPRFRMTRLCILLHGTGFGSTPRAPSWVPVERAPRWGPGRGSQTASKPVFLHLRAVDIWDWIILRWGGRGLSCALRGYLATSLASMPRTRVAPSPHTSPGEWQGSVFPGEIKPPPFEIHCCEEISLVCVFPSLIWMFSGDLFTSHGQWNLVSRRKHSPKEIFVFSLRTKSLPVDRSISDQSVWQRVSYKDTRASYKENQSL